MSRLEKMLRRMPEEETDMPIRKVYPGEMDIIYALAAIGSELEYEGAHKSFLARMKSVPGTYRDFRLVCKLVEKILCNMMKTMPPDKAVLAQNRMKNNMRFRIIFGREACKDKVDPKMQEVNEKWMMDEFVHAAWEDRCRMCMGSKDGGCQGCGLGRALTALYAETDRGRRSWGEVDILKEARV